MKKLSINLLSLSVIFLSLAIGRIGWCQNTLYSIQNMDTRKSIVREYKENVFVVFNVNQGNSFNLVDLTSLTVKSIDMLSINVNDFEIYNDYVYFCGMDGGTPCVGWFEISTVFSGGSMVEAGTLPTLNCNEYSPNNHVYTDVKKIEVMDIGGSIHLLIVGNATCSSAPATPARYFADVFFNGNTWKMEATLEHSGILYYDDVAVTDNYVVPVGHKNPANGEYIYALPKPVAPYTGLFFANTPVPGLHIFNITLHAYAGSYCYIVDASSEFIIEHITNDIFATACYGQCIPSGGSSYVSGTVFNLYNGVGLVNSRYCVAPYNNIYGDMRYNPFTRSVYLLPGLGSSAPNEYLEFFLDATYTFVPNITIHSDLSMTKYHSMDACTKTSGLSQAILSGDNKFLSLWRNNHFGESVCSRPYSPPFDIETCGQHSFRDYEFYYDDGKVPIVSFYPTLSSNTIIKTCSE